MSSALEPHRDCIGVDIGDALGEWMVSKRWLGKSKVLRAFVDVFALLENVKLDCAEMHGSLALRFRTGMVASFTFSCGVAAWAWRTNSE
jgi:hypothetical protein